MVSSIFHTVFYNPIYNVLVALVAYVPGGDVGVAIIILTLVIRVILLPFSLSVAKQQRLMRLHEAELAVLKEKHKDDSILQANKTFEFYREKGIRPFAPILLLFIQLPILLALYWVFRFETFITLDVTRLYSFTPLPTVTSVAFLGLISIGGKSLVLAFLAGVTQYYQAVLSLSGAEKPKGEGMQADFTRAINVQLRYVFPVLIAVIAYTTSAGIALYFVTTNVAGILQEWYVRNKFKHLSPPSSVVIQALP